MLLYNAENLTSNTITVSGVLGRFPYFIDRPENSQDNAYLLGDIPNDHFDAGFVIGVSNVVGRGNSLFLGLTQDGFVAQYEGQNYIYSTKDTLTAGTVLPFSSSGQYPINGGPGDPICFTTGTRIRTARGDVAVEDLRVGDRAVTASGTLRPVVWIGHRHLDSAGRTLPHDQQPIRIRAGAFGPGLPTRDLRLSPGHPVLVGADADGAGGHLVPIMCLINGTSIAREPVAAVTYWHVELDAHDVLLAEGLPAESYHDMGSRPWFAGADGPLVNPDFVPAGGHGRCRPVAVDGLVVEAERVRLSGVFAVSLDEDCGWDEAERFAWVAA